MNIKKNKVCGMLGVEAINSNFNANFEGEPKNINGKLIARDVCFKYAMKVAMNNDGEKIMGLKRMNKKNEAMTLKQVYEYLFDTKLTKKTTPDEIRNNILNCRDIKFFGATFASEVSTEVHGAIQLSTAVNVLMNSTIYLDNILSPYASSTGNKMSTNGEEFIVDKAHYIYNFIIDPQQYDKYDVKFTEEDYQIFKKYSLDCVTRLNSRTRVGCTNHFAMFIELQENQYINPNLRQRLIVDENKDNITYDLSKISKFLNDVNERIKNIEIYYNPESITLINIPVQTKIYDITTGKELK